MASTCNFNAFIGLKLQRLQHFHDLYLARPEEDIKTLILAKLIQCPHFHICPLGGDMTIFGSKDDSWFFLLSFLNVGPFCLL